MTVTRPQLRPGLRPVGILLVLTGLGLGVTLPAEAQLSYTRSTSVGTYTAISPGGGATAVAFADLNDGTTSIPLPFAFTYGGASYTTASFLAICTNGHAFLSTSSVTTPANNANFGPALGLPAMEPWFDNLTIGAVGANPAGAVLYQVAGVAGSQTLTVQWTDVSSFATVALGQPRRINFQLVLEEGSNAIEFRYGPTSGVAYNTGESASIGLAAAEFSYIDAITGSSATNTSDMTTNKWPTRFIRFTPGAPAPLAGGTYTVGAGQAYPSLSEAIADLNHRGIAGAVTLLLTDALYDSTNTTFPLLIGPVAGASAASPVMIEPAAGNATLSYRGTESGGTGSVSLNLAGAGPLLGVVGADYLTLRGLTLTSGGGTTLVTALLVMPSSTSDGAQHNTFRDLTVRQNRLRATSIAIRARSVLVPLGVAGTNSHNRYLNLTIEDVAAGIALEGNGTVPDEGNEIGVIDGGVTVIGGAAVNNLGGTSLAYGVRCLNQKDVTIASCEIRNITSTGTNTVDGILFESAGAYAGGVGVAAISSNRIHDLANLNVAAGVVTGIRATLPSTGGETRIHNNMVSGLQSNSTVTATRRIIGIALQPFGQATTGRHNVMFNSVRIAPTNPACSNTAYESWMPIDLFSPTAGGIVNLNNIYANFTGPQSGSAKHYAMFIGFERIGGYGSESDFNVLHVADPANGFVGSFNGVDKPLLRDWMLASGLLDYASRPFDPRFLSADDLHISSTLPNPVESEGTPIVPAWTSTDIDGQPRDPAYPDCGADEGDFISLSIVDGFVSPHEYGDHADGMNRFQSGDGEWFMTWDEENLYVGFRTAQPFNGLFFFLDKDPFAPLGLAAVGDKDANEESLLSFQLVATNPMSDGGTAANGNFNSGGPVNPAWAHLPFRADIQVETTTGNPYFLADGSGEWVPNTAAIGGREAYRPGGGIYGQGREFAIKWSALGGRPASFAWSAAAFSSVGIYSPAPAGNLTGHIGYAAVDEHYFLVDGSAMGPLAKPCSRNMPPENLIFSLDPPVPTGVTLGASSGMFDWTPTEAQGPSDYGLIAHVTDNGVPLLLETQAFTIHVHEVNQAPVLTVPGAQATTPGATLMFATSAIDADLPANTLGFSLIAPSPVGATIDPGTGQVAWTPAAAGAIVIRVVVSDGAGGADLADVAVTVASLALNVAITAPASGSVFPVGQPVAFSGSFGGDGPGRTHFAQWSFDTATQAGVVNDAAGTVTAMRTFTQAGVYLVRLTVTNDLGTTGTATEVGGVDAMVVIYDPAAGFVTGGGWITSPAGAYAANPGLSGKANFGFESRYKRGASIPTGETEFMFKLAGLTFHSTSYEWLVVAGSRAQYKGFGTINGSGSYRFLLTAIDGDEGGSPGPDRMRMKIWYAAGGGIVYDNQSGAADDTDDTTALGGGSIVIHTPALGGGNGGHAADAELGKADGAGLAFALQMPRPNPFRGATDVAFDLPMRGEVELTVHDVRGREVARIPAAEFAAGSHHLRWVAREDRGAPLAAGTYFVRLDLRTADGARLGAVRKIVLVR